MAEDNGWGKWENLVLAELKRLNTNFENLDSKNSKDHTTIFTALATLKVKSGIWGVIGGAVPVAIGIAYLLLTSM